MTERMGDKIPAGLGVSTVLPDFDFETYSEAGYVWRDGLNKWISLPGCSKKGLFAVGAPVYAEHPSTEILSVAYDLKDGRGKHLWMPDMQPPVDLLEHVAQGLPLEAWNSLFEFLIWNHVGVRRHGWPALPLNQLFCAMAKARKFGLPGKLEIAAEVVGGELKHAAAGKRVIQRYSIPRNPTKNDPRRRIHPMGDGARGLELYSYNWQDIVAEGSVSRKCPDLPPLELELWRLDQKINVRGVPIDMPAVESAIGVLDYMEDKYNRELQALTRGQVARYSEVSKIIEYVSEYDGLRLPNLDEDTLNDILSRPGLEANAERVLRIRQQMSSAGVKKLRAMQRLASYDDRVRDLYTYHGPHTGRWSSGGIQLQNMKSEGPSLHFCYSCQYYYSPGTFDACPDCGEIPQEAKAWKWNPHCAESIAQTLYKHSGNPAAVEQVLGVQTLPCLAASIRGLIKAPPGKEFICSDYTAIEAVVLAALAGEEWRLEVFRTHGRIYEKTASDITGVPFEELLEYKKIHRHDHPHRKPYGKVPELASGYGGWVGGWKAFGADEFFTDDEIKKHILAWRAKSPMIVELWGGQWRKHPDKWEFTWDLYGLEGNAIAAVLNPGTEYTYRYITYFVRDDILYCRLPSGRHLHYHQPRLDEGIDPYSGNPIWKMSHMMYNTNPKKGKVGWTRVSAYYGSLTENCIAEGTLVLTDRGWVPIESVTADMKVHDGVDFVPNYGVLFKGLQTCITVNGVDMTPDHEVLTDEGWKAASQVRKPYIPKIRGVNMLGPLSQRPRPDVLAFPMRLWRDMRAKWRRSEACGKKGVSPELRVLNQETPIQGDDSSRHDKAPRVRCLPEYDRPLPSAVASSLEKLWRSGNHCLRSMASAIREFLGGYGAFVSAWTATGPQGQRPGLLTGKLSMGNPPRKLPEQKEQSRDQHPLGRDDGLRGRRESGPRKLYPPVPVGSQLAPRKIVHISELYESRRVYDILNCGPRNRFVVNGDTGPFIVHNCTQAAARDIFAWGMLNVERAGYPIVLHTHDEMMSEIDEGFGSIEDYEQLMCDLPDWCADWPIKAAGGWRGKRYRKD